MVLDFFLFFTTRKESFRNALNNIRTHKLAMLQHKDCSSYLNIYRVYRNTITFHQKRS